MRRLGWVLALMALVAVGGLLGVALLSDDADVGSPGPVPTTTPTTSPTGDAGSPSPTKTVTSPGPGDLERFREACLGETRALTEAIVSYESSVDVTVGEPHRFRIRIAGEAQATSSDSPAVANQPLAVSCTIQARLLASGTDLDVSPGDWVEQRYVPPDPSTWTWVVTAQSSGDSDAVLQLKPTIRVANRSGDIEVADLRTEEFEVAFVASRTPGAFFSSLWAGVIALAAGLTTLIGAYVAIRHFRRADPAEKAGPDAPAPP